MTALRGARAGGVDNMPEHLRSAIGADQRPELQGERMKINTLASMAMIAFALVGCTKPASHKAAEQSNKAGQEAAAASVAANQAQAPAASGMSSAPAMDAAKAAGEHAEKAGAAAKDAADAAKDAAKK